MRYTTIPQRTDKGINYNTYEATVRQANKSKNLKFDAAVFFVQEDPSGTFVSIRPTTAEGGTENYEFDVTMDSANTCSVASGHIIVQGSNGVVVEVANVSGQVLTGEFVYPTVQIPIANVAASTITFPADLPTPDSTNAYYPLVEIECTSYPVDESTYEINDPRIYHGFISLSNPITYT